MTDFTPARIIQIELAQPLPNLSPLDARTDQRYRRAISLVRLHTQPLGVIEVILGEDGLSAADLAKEIDRALSSEISAHLSEDGLPHGNALTAAGLPAADLPKCLQARQAILDDPPRVSIIIATRDRPEQLKVCLGSLNNLDYPNFDIIVVDNAPTTPATADFIRQEYGDSTRVRYVREERPGGALARNRGLAEAKAGLVAFTDDDVVVDRHWLAELVRGFSAAENAESTFSVACVTGMILPAELESPAQAWIEQFGGFGKGFQRRIFDLGEHRPKNPLYPYTAGMFGSGANMAFKTSVLREIGGFDPALGPGSAAMGGEELAVFFELVSRNYRLVYQPSAILHHWHHRDYSKLRKIVYSYGVGLTAYLTKTLIDHPERLLGFVARVPHGFVYVLGARSPKNAKKQADYPKELTWIERKGMLAGPLAYLRSRWRLRRVRKAG